MLFERSSININYPLKHSLLIKSLGSYMYLLTLFTARKTIFPKSWSIMKSSKIPRKYQLSIKLLDQKMTVFPISEKFKTRTFPYSENMVFHAEENIILHQLFESKEDRISHLWKVQNNNFPIIWTFPFVQSSCFCNTSFFFIRKTFFCLSLNFLNIMLEIRVRFS